MNKADLISNIETYFATTGNRAITAAQLREVLTAFVNSYPNLEDDADLLTIGEYDPDKSYAEGSLTLHDGALFIATLTATGAWDETLWLAFPFRACVLAVDKWVGAVASEGDVIRHHFRLYISGSDFNLEEPGTGSAWTEMEVYQPTNAREYISNRYYQDLDIVEVNGSLYKRDGDGYSTDLTTDVASEKFVLIEAVTKRMRIEIGYQDMISTDLGNVVGHITFTNKFPAGTVFRSVKMKVVSPFAGGGNSTADMVAYHTAVDISNQMLAGDVAGSVDQLVNTSINSLPSNSAAADFRVGVTVDWNWSEINVGEIHFIIDYTIAQI